MSALRSTKSAPKTGKTAPSEPTPPKQDATKLAKLLAMQLDDDKAENILEINLLGKSSIADAMIIASGRSQRHVASLADHLVRKLKDEGMDKPRVEGLPGADWVLIDAGDVIVHIFRPEVREFYNLERIWAGEAPKPHTIAAPEA